MEGQRRRVIVVGGGTAGSVLAARLSEDPLLSVTLVEAGPDHDAYDAGMLEPIRAAEAWAGLGQHLAVTPMATETGAIRMMQGRLLRGTSAVNALATVRGQPADYDAWADAGASAGGVKTGPGGLDIIHGIGPSEDAACSSYARGTDTHSLS